MLTKGIYVYMYDTIQHTICVQHTYTRPYLLQVVACSFSVIFNAIDILKSSVVGTTNKLMVICLKPIILVWLIMAIDWKP